MSKIKNWQKGNGSYKIGEIETGTKYLENTTAGTTAIPSKQAYGEWEFDVYKSGSPDIHFLNNSLNNWLNTNSYVLRITGFNEIGLRRSNIGSYSTLSTSASNYFLDNVWYRIKVARLQSEGVFKDIDTLQTSDLVNDSYTTFTTKGRYGFTVTSDGSGIHNCGTADEIPIVSGVKYLVEFDAKINSGTAPTVEFSAFSGSIPRSNIETVTEGRNSFVLTATLTTTGLLQFENQSTTTDYEISGLTIRRIYPADTFAVFIKGGSFGDDWTLVSTAGGSGTNPVTDSTYTTSEYFVLDLDAGDRIANIKIKSGVEQ